MRGKPGPPRNERSAGFVVRKEGLEPSRFYPPDPKSGASANSATFAGEVLLKGIAVRMESPESRVGNCALETENDSETSVSGRVCHLEEPLALEFTPRRY